MAKMEGFSLISSGDSPPPSTILQILKQAAELAWRSRKPLLPILLILLFPHALLFFCSYLVITPLTTDMTVKFFTMSNKDPRSPEYQGLLTAAMKDLREITGVEVAVMLVSFLLSSLLLMAAVHTVAMARKGEQETLKGVLCRIRSAWKGPVVTELYVTVMSFAYIVVLVILAGVLAFFANGSMAALILLGVVVAVFVFLLLLYLQMLWYQGLVISVVEEDCYGVAALVKASELIRGRRKLGFGVNFVLMVIAVVISMAYSFVNTHLPAGKTTQLVAGLVSTCTNQVMSAFMLVVYVVFYYECKSSHEEAAAMKQSFVYTRVPAAPALDGALP